MSDPNPQTLTDAQLVQQAKQGDLDAFEELANRHERRIYTLARRITQNEHDAQDVTQQTFLSALEHLGDFREEASFATWLDRIATHAALKILRKRKGLDTVSLDQATDPDPDTGEIPHPEYIADWRADPEELVHRNEIRQLLDQALAQLDEKYRLVFLLRDVEGLSVRETAELLGLSETNVKVRLLRARLQLREHLTRVLGDPARRIEPHPHHYP
jgi:RNA polymerase sigma-70 factor (ECF subfamily)